MSDRVKYLLIGGGLASCEAIKGIREQDQEGSILLVGQEPHLPYNRPPLSKGFMRGDKQKADLFCEMQDFYDDNEVELLLGTQVEKLDAGGHLAYFDDAEEVTFQKVLLATGGTPIRPDIPGIDMPNVHLLRTLDDSETIREAALSDSRGVIIGAGFIGMELSAALTERGVAVTGIEAADRVWPKFADPVMASQLEDYYRRQGVNFLVNTKVSEIKGSNGRAQWVITEAGERVPCDFVCAAVGIRLNLDLAVGAELRIDNGVVVNEYMQTSHPDVFAAGDIANYPDPYFAKRRRVEHWGQAEYTGRLAGGNMAGAHQKYGLLTYVWSDGFDLHFEFAGEEGVFDEVVHRGEFGTPGYTAFYLEAGRLQAFLAINPDKADLGAMETMIKDKMDLSARKADLSNPNVKL